MEQHKFTTQVAACRLNVVYVSIPYHNFYTHIGAEAILDLKKGKI